MPDEYTFESAAEALQNAAQQDAASEQAESQSIRLPGGEEGTTEPRLVEREPVQPTPESEGQDSFTRTDLAALTEGLDPEVASRVEQAYKAFQGDYTRSKQELAQERQAWGDTDPQQAAQALQFVQALESDPNFLLSTTQELARIAAAQGLITPDDSYDEDGYVDEEDYGAPAQDPRLDAIVGWISQQEQRQQEQQLAFQIQNEHMQVTSAHPDWKESDIQRVYQLAFAHGGSLVKAAQAYESWRNDMLGGYIDQKGTVSSGTSQPRVTGHAEIPITPPSSFEDASKQAHGILRAMEGAG